MLIEVFINYIEKHKNSYYKLAIEKKILYIENAIQRDLKFKNMLKGIIVGQFSVEEYKIYVQDPSKLNKRIMNMVIERLKNQIQLFENPILTN